MGPVARVHDDRNEERPVVDEDDRSLVAHARVDPRAFGALYGRYVDRIYAYAFRRTRSREAAEDVTAATFEAALRHLGDFDCPERGMGPWLFRIASRQLVDHYRREARPASARGQRALRALADPPGEDDVARVEAGHDIATMLDALTTLRPRYQQALSLRFLAGLDHDEAAAALGCSKPLMAVTVHRALVALRRALDRERGGR